VLVVAVAVLAAPGCQRANGAPKSIWVAGAREALERAVSDARRSKDDYWAATQIAYAAEVMARIDKQRASRLIDQAVRRAGFIRELSPVLVGARTTEGGPVRGQGRIGAFETVGRSAARIDRKRAVELLERAMGLAEKAPPAAGFDRGAAMAAAASEMAKIEPQRALQQVRRIAGAHNQARVLVAVATTFAETDPDLAERTLERATRLFADAGKKDRADAARAQITAALARHFPRRAAALLPAIRGRWNHDLALFHLVQATARRDPKQALAYAGMIRGPGGRVAALLELATSQPHNARRYLAAAAASAEQELARADWKAPVPMTADVSQVALALATNSQKTDALSLINVAAQRVRANAPGKLTRLKALMLLSGAASQASPALARDLLEEVLKCATPDMIGSGHADLPLEFAAGPLGVLDPGLGEACVPHIPSELRALAFFGMATEAAGSRPALAQRWLRRGQGLDNSTSSWSTPWSRAIAEASLMPHPRYALQTAASYGDARTRPWVYRSVARAFLDRPPHKGSTRSALAWLAFILDPRFPPMGT
jgi:hypothetical protein